MASRQNGTLDVGITSNLAKRVSKHKEGVVAGFTRKYNIKQLVWYEVHASAQSAMTREKHIKKWKRNWKIELTEISNPIWEDLGRPGKICSARLFNRWVPACAGTTGTGTVIPAQAGIQRARRAGPTQQVKTA